MSFTEFLVRVCILITVLAAIACVDLLRQGRQATRWREYSFLLACGVLGSGFGIATDHVTARISPEYFVFGKWLHPGTSFFTEVTALGFQAGFVAGVIGGGAMLVVNRPQQGRLPLAFRRLAWLIWRPLVGALVFGAVGALAVSVSDPLGYANEYARFIPEAALPCFLGVAGFHLGLYLGFAIGLFSACRTIRIRLTTTAEIPVGTSTPPASTEPRPQP